MPAREAGAGGLGRADPRWVEMAMEIMGEHKDESTPGKAKVIQSIGPRLVARYPGEEICLPKRSTAYGWLAELERRQPTFGVSGKRRRARYAISREQFWDLHHGQRLSFTEIGQRTGYSRTAISDLARAYEIPTSIYRDGKQLKAPANVEG